MCICNVCTLQALQIKEVHPVAHSSACFMSSAAIAVSGLENFAWCLDIEMNVKIEHELSSIFDNDSRLFLDAQEAKVSKRTVDR